MNHSNKRKNIENYESKSKIGNKKNEFKDPVTEIRGPTRIEFAKVKNVEMSDASSTYVKNCHKKRSSDEKLADRIVNNYLTFSNYQKLSKATEPPKSRPQDEISNNINQQSSS
ncbi:24724_t:CDS:2 [Gigaspora margarita]|uniref:24724_t:CDS:1 n=1 Tax=Gigaspora margarita TaxID=4874 RepID=A0ABN7UWX8_GIGMA|nr:24724_t:CDS:2 [Gigaspora margarita]